MTISGGEEAGICSPDLSLWARMLMPGAGNATIRSSRVGCRLFPPLLYLFMYLVAAPSPSSIFSYSSSPSLRRERPHPTPVYQPTLAHQVTAGSGTSSPTEARQDNTARGRDTEVGNRVRNNHHSNCWGTHMETKLHICYICSGDLGSAPASSLVGGSVSVSPHGPRLVDSVGLLVSLTTPVPAILP